MSSVNVIPPKVIGSVGATANSNDAIICARANNRTWGVRAKGEVELERAGRLELLSPPEWRNADGANDRLLFSLPRQGVSLLAFGW